ncbi:MAG: glycosyl transferase [Clostridia bacterium]|nr:glycosyl transferase [Clostridia bacterium]
MIPKIIHYIWLGKGETPKVFDKCLASWKKYCPDWEIKRWDESNLNIDLCPYVREAYDARKFAFASDVLRLDVLNRFGGVYLDIDVELLKPIDEFLDEYAFTGFETSGLIAPGLILACEKENLDFVAILNSYKSRHFLVDGVQDTKTICQTFTEYYEKFGLKAENITQKVNNFTVYASEYFSPYDVITNKKKITSKTYSIHWYNASWYTPWQKFKRGCKKCLNFVSFGLFGKVLQKVRKK